MLESPGYDALTVTLPAAAPVAAIEHVPPAASAQVAGEGKVTLPVLPEACENVTAVPATAPEVPVIVAVQVDAAPMATEAGRQLTVVVVAPPVTVSVPVPELAALFASPG